MQTYKIGKFTFGILAVGLLLACTASSASAQLPPPISPWLQMFNYNRGGALSNYHTFVVPQQHAIQEFHNQERQIRQQGAQQQQLQTEVDKVLNQPKKKINMGASRASGYRQYLHFYPTGMQNGGVPHYSTPGRRRY